MLRHAVLENSLKRKFWSSDKKLDKEFEKIFDDEKFVGASVLRDGLLKKQYRIGYNESMGLVEKVTNGKSENFNIEDLERFLKNYVE